MPGPIRIILSEFVEGRWEIDLGQKKILKHIYSRYRLVRYRIQREIGYMYNAMVSVCMCVCVSVENRLEREIAYSTDFFQSQVPRTKRYPVYFWQTCQKGQNGTWFFRYSVTRLTSSIRLTHVSGLTI